MPNTVKMDHHTEVWLPWLVATSYFMQMLDGTIVNTALPSIAYSLGISPLTMQAVPIAYMLTLAVFLPASGFLTDYFSPKKVMIVSISLFTIGSFLCAISSSLHFMVFARIIQGLGGALMTPVGRLVILRLYPHDQLLRVLSLIPIPGLFGSLIGPTLGGFLVEYASWQWIFIINIPVGVLGIVATARLMPNFEKIRDKKFDFIGFFLFGLSLVVINIALDGLGNLGLSLWIIILLCLFGAVAQLVYWVKLAPKKDSLFKPSIFKYITFTIGLVSNLIGRLGASALPFLLPLMLQVCLGYSALISGVFLIPIALASVLVKLIATPLAERFNCRILLIITGIMQGLIIISLVFTPLHLNLWVFCLQLTLFGAFNSLQFSYLNTYTLIELSYEDSGSGNALMSVAIMLAQSLGIALSAAFLLLFQGGSNVTDANVMLSSFHKTYLVIGAITSLSAFAYFFSPKSYCE